MEKTIEYYMSLPYTIELRREAEEGWFVQVKELRGCMSQGETREEALAMIQEAMELWLEVALEDKLSIPEPRNEEDYSGKFVVRVPQSLHRELVESAAQEGVSLNQYINVALAKAVAYPPTRARLADPMPGGATGDPLPSRQHFPGWQSTQAGSILQEGPASYAGGEEGSDHARAAEQTQDGEA